LQFKAINPALVKNFFYSAHTVKILAQVGVAICSCYPSGYKVHMVN